MAGIHDGGLEGSNRINNSSHIYIENARTWRVGHSMHDGGGIVHQFEDLNEFACRVNR